MAQIGQPKRIIVVEPEPVKAPAPTEPVKAPVPAKTLAELFLDDPLFRITADEIKAAMEGRKV